MARILAVDDALAIRCAIEHILTTYGHDVFLFENGKEALKFARNEDVDLVITDLNMPEMNGMSLITSLRRIESYKRIPILIMTTESSDYKKKKGKSVGATGWITKPFTEERIKAALNKVLS